MAPATRATSPAPKERAPRPPCPCPGPTRARDPCPRVAPLPMPGPRNPCYLQRLSPARERGCADAEGDNRVIYICVPAHDEGQTVGVVLWKIRQVMAEAGRDYQILVADDGSSDKTNEVLEPYTRVLPLTVMRSDARRGYAASLEMLLREAVHRSEYPRRDAIIVLQADFTEEPDHVATLLKRIESGADVVFSNPVGAEPVSFKQRLARWMTKLLLRRFDWPEGLADPMAGYHAYRVSVVRRAFEASTGRLLRWDGRAANAALMRAALPHARRVDSVEWTPRPERRQRPTRFDLGGQVRSVWALARNQEVPGLLPVADLAPSSVRTARTEDHPVTVKSLRQAGVTRPSDEERPKRKGRSRNGRGQPGVKDGRRERGETGKARSPASPEEAKGSRKKRSRRRKPAKAGEDGQAAPEAVAEGDAPVKRPRKRGGRSGRRRRPPAEAADTTAGSAADVAETPEAAASGNEKTGSGRRRRGRRGGRRRGRGRGAAGESKATDSGGNGSGETPPSE